MSRGLRGKHNAASRDVRDSSRIDRSPLLQPLAATRVTRATRRRWLTRIARGASALAVAFITLDSPAASLQISPVIIDFAADTQASGLTLHNPGDKPLYGQVRVFRWRQSDGQDQLTPTDDLIASPPLIQVGPNSEQLVRLVRRSTTTSPIEASYRLLIDELPAAEDNPTAGVTIRLRYSVPVFVAAASPAAQPILHWQVTKENGQWWLSVLNSGNRHAQIAAIDLKNAVGKRYQINKGLLGYALAGQSRRWLLPIAADAPLGKQAIVHAMINASPSDAAVDVNATITSHGDALVSPDAAPVAR